MCIRFRLSYNVRVRVRGFLAPFTLTHCRIRYAKRLLCWNCTDSNFVTLVQSLELYLTVLNVRHLNNVPLRGCAWGVSSSAICQAIRPHQLAFQQWQHRIASHQLFCQFPAIASFSGPAINMDAVCHRCFTAGLPRRHIVALFVAYTNNERISPGVGILLTIL